MSTTCPRCKTPNAKFHRRTRANGTVTRRGACIDCERKAALDWQARNHEHVKQRKRDWYSSRPEGYTSRKHMESRLRRMGYDEVEIPKIIEWIKTHDLACDICHREPSGYRWERLHLDHDDETGCIRGLLCPPCNMSLGKFDHDVERLQAAIDYLQRSAVFDPRKEAL